MWIWRRDPSGTEINMWARTEMGSTFGTCKSDIWKEVIWSRDKAGEEKVKCASPILISVSKNTFFLFFAGEVGICI